MSLHTTENVITAIMANRYLASPLVVPLHTRKPAHARTAKGWHDHAFDIVLFECTCACILNTLSTRVCMYTSTVTIRFSVGVSVQRANVEIVSSF